MSFENHSLNSSCESNSVGMMKWSRAHSSAMLFWMGVPVRRRRLRQLKPNSTFQRRLRASEGHTTHHSQHHTSFPSPSPSPPPNQPVTALDGLSLVQDHVLPLDALEVLGVSDHKLVAGDEDVERSLTPREELLQHKVEGATGEVG